MRPIRWDDGTRWDDINARWGSPSYVLEPGDPGYVDPNPGPPPKPKKKPTIMSSNATPNNRGPLVGLAKAIRAGQLSHGAAVGLLRHLAPEMDLRIKALDGDLGAADGSPARLGTHLFYRGAIDATGAAREAFTTLSDGAVKEWLEGYRKVMEGIHGKKANTGWQAAGFPAGKTGVPRNHEARLDLLSAGGAYLSAHPDYETSLPRLDLPPLAITSAAAGALYTPFLAASTLIATREGEEADAKSARDADLRALFEEVSATINELRDALASDDPRWEHFGLNIPANPSPPLGVTGLTLTAAGEGRELAAWLYAIRAEYYRVFRKILGIDLEPVNVADPADLEYTLKDLPAGATIEVFVVPMNEAGAGPASATVTKVVGS